MNWKIHRSVQSSCHNNNNNCYYYHHYYYFNIISSYCNNWNNRNHKPRKWINPTMITTIMGVWIKLFSQKKNFHFNGLSRGEKNGEKKFSLLFSSHLLYLTILFIVLLYCGIVIHWKSSSDSWWRTCFNLGGAVRARSTMFFPRRWFAIGISAVKTKIS